MNRPTSCTVAARQIGLHLKSELVHLKDQCSRTVEPCKQSVSPYLSEHIVAIDDVTTTDCLAVLLSNF